LILQSLKPFCTAKIVHKEAKRNNKTNVKWLWLNKSAGNRGLFLIFCTCIVQIIMPEA